MNIVCNSNCSECPIIKNTHQTVSIRNMEHVDDNSVSSTRNSKQSNKRRREPIIFASYLMPSVYLNVLRKRSYRIVHNSRPQLWVARCTSTNLGMNDLTMQNCNLYQFCNRFFDTIATMSVQLFERFTTLSLPEYCVSKMQISVSSALFKWH